jgi:uncharacterized membrane protein YqgA involved in biofilm formation
MLRSALFFVFSTLVLVAAVYFFFRTGQLITTRDYVGGLLHLVAGLALTRAAVELARLSVLSGPRDPA